MDLTRSAQRGSEPRDCMDNKARPVRSNFRESFIFMMCDSEPEPSALPGAGGSLYYRPNTPTGSSQRHGRKARASAACPRVGVVAERGAHPHFHTAVGGDDLLLPLFSLSPSAAFPFLVASSRTAATPPPVDASILRQLTLPLASTFFHCSHR